MVGCGPTRNTWDANTIPRHHFNDRSLPTESLRAIVSVAYFDRRRARKGFWQGTQLARGSESESCAVNKNSSIARNNRRMGGVIILLTFRFSRWPPLNR